MLSIIKVTVIAVSVILLSTGCQNISLRSDSWKQQQIVTMYRQYAKEFSQVESITVVELQQLQQQGKQVVLVDVRSPKEIAVSSIPGAISTAEFERNLAQYRNYQIIGYCTIGYRSGKYAQKLQQQGVKMLNLEGSLLAWSHAQGKLVNSIGDTNKVHVFGRQWQLTARNYQPVW